MTKEVYYVQDESGDYTTALSKGWDVKSEALNVAWNDIEERIKHARARVEKGEASPILFFMEYRLMDMPILTGYTGFWKWTIKRHMKPRVFNNLSQKKLQRYAEAFNVTVDELKQMKISDED